MRLVSSAHNMTVTCRRVIQFLLIGLHRIICPTISWTYSSLTAWTQFASVNCATEETLAIGAETKSDDYLFAKVSEQGEDEEDEDTSLPNEQVGQETIQESTLWEIKLVNSKLSVARENNIPVEKKQQSRDEHTRYVGGTCVFKRQVETVPGFEGI